MIYFINLGADYIFLIYFGIMFVSIKKTIDIEYEVENCQDEKIFQTINEIFVK